MVLKLILVSLVRIGYRMLVSSSISLEYIWTFIFSSSGFQVLQAGHYGVAQTQRRLIVLAAAPGETLPLFPEPMHTFAWPHYLEVKVDGRKYSPTCKRPVPPRRALSVWDCISDLPPIQSGHDDPLRYGGGPQSHLQSLLRANKGDVVEDHISKNVGSLVSGLIVRKPPEAILSLTISILCNTRSGVKTSAQQICS